MLAATDAGGHTALAAAMRSGRERPVRALLRHGASTAGAHVPAGCGTLLHVGARCSACAVEGDVVGLLVQLGVAVDERESAQGRTPYVTAPH